MPSSDSGDDFVGIGSPCEGLGLDVVLVRLMAAWRSAMDPKTRRFNRRLVSLAKDPSTALSHEQEVGVKVTNVRNLKSRSTQNGAVSFRRRHFANGPTADRR
jgi:hypothetical protein